MRIKVLVSGILPSFSGMSSVSPTMDVSIGDIGPLAISLEPKPADLNEHGRGSRMIKEGAQL